MHIPDILIGTFQVKDQNEMDRIVYSAIDAGICGFDTAPSYSTEGYLGNSLKKKFKNNQINRMQIWIQDKIDAVQMFQHEENGIKKHVYTQLLMFGLEYLDVLLIHWPFKQYFLQTWEQIVDLKSVGLVQYIGVCNLDVRGYRILFEANGLCPPDIIQNEISPLNNCNMDNIFFRQKKIKIEAYSPLCRMINTISADVGLKKIADSKGTNIGKVILKWHMQKGIHPVFASKNPMRIYDNAHYDFSLSQSDMSYIEGLDQHYKIFPMSYGCPGY